MAGTTKANKKEADKEEAIKETSQDSIQETTPDSMQKELKEEVKNEITISGAKDPDDYDFTALGFDEAELDGLTGMDSINANDIRIVYGKFWAVTKDGYEAGDIALPDETVIKGSKGEILRELSVLKPQTVRVYFPEKYNPKNTFICRSLDGVKGANDGQSKYAGRSCAECEFSKFPDEGGSSKCREQILLLLTLSDGTVFHLLVSGLSVADWKKSFLSVEMMKGLSLVKKKLKKGILAALNVEASVSVTNTDYGEKPVLQFRVNKEKPLHSFDRIKANLEAYSSYKQFDEQEAIASAATFAQKEQGEYKEEEAEGENANMF